jgi:hypothetical protein
VRANQPSSEIFSRFVAGIEDDRLKRAFAAVVQDDQPETFPAH